MAYESRKNNSVGKQSNENANATQPRSNQKNDPTKQMLEKGAEAAGRAYGGELGAKAAKAIAKSKTGQKILNKGANAINSGAEKLNKIPGMANAMKNFNNNNMGMPNKNMNPANNQKTPNQDTFDDAEESTSSESSFGENIAGLNPFSKKKKSNSILGNDKDTKESKETSFEGFFQGNGFIKKVIAIMVPVIVLVFCFTLTTTASSSSSDFEDALGADYAAGEDLDEEEFDASTPEAQEFYDRLNDVKLSMQSQGKTVDTLKVAAVYHIIARHTEDIDYEDMTESAIEEIANAMFDGNSYNEETFRQNLITTIFPQYLPDDTEEDYELYVDEVFQYIEDYYDFIGEEESSCAAIGTCIYEIKGFYIKGRGNVNKEMSITDLKVRLMQCGGNFGGGTWGKPLDEELVPFEDYVMGVAYQEIGPSAPDEAIKAQMVAARSYSLARPTVMGDSLGKKLDEEDGQWILQLSNCVADQVYCSVDKGCSAMNDGEQYGTVRTGTTYSKLLKNPLPADHKLRSLAAEVQGEVLVNDQGYIINAGYTQTEQDKFTSLAKQGMNYKQILLQVYNQGSRDSGASDIEKMSCNDGSTGDCTSGNISSGPYASWKQCGSSWSNISLGSSSHTICSAGCLVTSVAMQIAKSGVPVNISNFNPGTFVQFLNKNGGFTGANFYWGTTSKVAPSFKYQDKVYVSGYSKEQKLNEIKKLLDKGAYVVAEVKGNTGQHWVAIDAISGDNVIMMDPASQSTNMWSQYNWKNTSTLAYYMVQN